MFFSQVYFDVVNCVRTHDKNETLIASWRKQQIEISTVKVLTTLEEKIQRHSLAGTLGDKESKLERQKAGKGKQ